MQHNEVLKLLLKLSNTDILWIRRYAMSLQFQMEPSFFSTFYSKIWSLEQVVILKNYQEIDWG